MATRFSNSGALASLAVSYTLRLAAAFQWSVRNLIDVESYMTSCVRAEMGCEECENGML